MPNFGIVAFAFGVPSTIFSNEEIAAMADVKSTEFGNAPIFSQKDVQFSDDLYVERITSEDPDNPPPTLRIARDAIQWAKKRGINTIIVVAANPHLWRALRDTKRAVCEKNLRISVYPCRWRRSNSFWFCHESTQKRTRTWWNWWSREIIVRLMPFWLYKRVAS
jgi:hypothetical protein